MLFLILAVLASSVLAIVLKYLSSGYTYGVYLVNYVTCALLAFLTMKPRSLWNGDPFPLWLGVVSGFLYLAALVVYAYSIRKNGAVLSSVFTRLGVLVPVLVSVVLFGERPTVLQCAGIAVAIAAAVVMNGLPKKDKKQGVAGAMSLGVLLLTLLFNGSADSMSKIFTQLGSRQDDGLFVFYIFLFAGLFTLVLLLREKQKLTRRDLMFGVLVGDFLCQLCAVSGKVTASPALRCGDDFGGAGSVESVMAQSKRIPKKCYNRNFSGSFFANFRLLFCVTKCKRNCDFVYL